MSWVSKRKGRNFPAEVRLCYRKSDTPPAIAGLYTKHCRLLEARKSVFKANSGREGLFLSAFQAVDAQHDLYHWEDSALRVFRALTPSKICHLEGFPFFTKNIMVFCGGWGLPRQAIFLSPWFFSGFHVASSLEISGFASSSAGSSTTKSAACMRVVTCNLQKHLKTHWFFPYGTMEPGTCFLDLDTVIRKNPKPLKMTERNSRW